MSASRHEPGPALLPALAYILVTGICMWLLKSPLAEAGLWLRAGVSLVPVIPIALTVRAVVRKVAERDEMHRRIDLEALAASSVLVALGTLTLSLLMVAGVFHVTGRQALQWILPALWIGYALARVWAARRYK